MDAEVISFTTDSGTGEQIVSLAGSFTPNLIVIMSIGRGGTPDVFAVKANFIFSAASGTSGVETRCVGGGSSNGGASMATGREASDTLQAGFGPTTGFSSDFDVTSFDSGGFTINLLTGGSKLVTALVLNVDNAFVGSFACPAETGANAITGVGFQPNLIIPFSHGATADAYSLHNNLTIGGSDGTNEFCVSATDESGVPTSDSGRHHHTSACINILDAASGASKVVATLDSLDMDGFTPNFTAVSTGVVINYIAIKAPEVKVLPSYTHADGVESQTVAGAGFTPKCVLEFSVQASADTATDGMSLCAGWATGSSNEASCWVGSEHNSGTSNADRCQSIEALSLAGDTAQATVEKASFTAFTADGHTKAWSVAEAFPGIGSCIWLGETTAASTTTTTAASTTTTTAASTTTTTAASGIAVGTLATLGVGC